MDDNTKDLLIEQIETELKGLNNLKGDDKQKAIDGIATLYKLKLDELKIDNESVAEYNRITTNDAHYERDDEFRREQIKEDRLAKDQQAKDQKIGKLIEIGANVAATFAGLFAYNHWFNKGLKFEETGTVCTSWVRNVISKMTPKK